MHLAPQLALVTAHAVHDLGDVAELELELLAQTQRLAGVAAEQAALVEVALEGLGDGEQVEHGLWKIGGKLEVFGKDVKMALALFLDTLFHNLTPVELRLKILSTLKRNIQKFSFFVGYRFRYFQIVANIFFNYSVL